MPRNWEVSALWPSVSDLAILMDNGSLWIGNLVTGQTCAFCVASGRSAVILAVWFDEMAFWKPGALCKADLSDFGLRRLPQNCNTLARTCGENMELLLLMVMKHVSTGWVSWLTTSKITYSGSYSASTAKGSSDIACTMLTLDSLGALTSLGRRGHNAPIARTACSAYALCAPSTHPSRICRLRPCESLGIHSCWILCLCFCHELAKSHDSFGGRWFFALLLGTKWGLPAYQVLPASDLRSPAQTVAP